MSVRPSVPTHTAIPTTYSVSPAQEQLLIETKAGTHVMKPAPIDNPPSRDEGSSAGPWIVLATVAIVGIAAFLVWNDTSGCEGYHV